MDEPRPGLVPLAERTGAAYVSSPSAAGFGSRSPNGFAPHPKHAGSWCGGMPRVYSGHVLPDAKPFPPTGARDALNKR